MAYKSKYTSAEIENKLDVVYNKYFNPVVPDEPVEPEPLPLGVFIQHTSGWLFTTEEWTEKGFPNEEANGVAVSTEECAFVIAKENISTSKYWSSDTQDAVDGLALISDWSEVTTDFNGKKNTELMLATDTSGAGYSCANFTFPNGKKGYLPSLGELNTARNFNINKALNIIGGTSLEYKTFWSSTQVSNNAAWTIMWTGGTIGQTGKKTLEPVRPFTTLKPEDIPSVEPTPPEKPEETPLGVFIQHVDGSLYTADEWTAKGFASADANGVAVSAEECKFVVAKNCPDWGVINGVIEGVTIAETAEEAIKDMNGISNTEAIVSVASYGAAVICANYTFPNGKKGYLGAAGEWQKVFENKIAFEEAYSVLGITTSFSSGVWTSTIRSDASYSGWKCNWKVGIQNAYKSDRIPVYPFTTL